MTYLVVILGLLLLIFLHELGHFTAARAVGIKPRKFYVGFPPALAKVTRNGVEYGIGTIPLGGYVRIPGMHRPAARDFDLWIRPALHEEAALVPVVQRIRRALDVSDFAAARAELPELRSVLDGAHLAPAAARQADRAVRELDEGTGPDAYWRQRTWKRIVVIAAGPLANVAVAFAVFLGVSLTGAPTSAQSTSVGLVESGTPAAAAGLKAGDRIVAVDGTPTRTFEAISSHIRAHHGTPVTLTVVRHGTTLNVGPRRTVEQSGYWIFGFVPGQTLRSYGFVDSVRRSGSLLWQITSGTGSAIGGLFHARGRSQLTGTVGIVHDSAQALQQGWPDYLMMVGLVSMSLALLNLLPLLPLDGGHIAVSLIEAIRRRAAAREVYERISFVGLALILFVAFIALQNDVSGLTRH